MKILYFFKSYESYMSQWQYTHIIDELKYNGHTIDVYNPLDYRSMDEANEKLLPYLKSSATTYDLFLNCESDTYLYPETVAELKKTGIATALICFDNLHAPHIHKSLAPLFDVVWLTSSETIPMFEKWGCKNILFQTYAANPQNFQPQWSSDILRSVCFIGSPYGSRINVINGLTKNSIPTVVYTNALSSHQSYQKKESIPGQKKNKIREIAQALSFSIGRKVLWSAVLNKTGLGDKSVLDMNNYLQTEPSVSFERMQKLYSDHTLSLNITALRNTYLLKQPVQKIHLRTFEIPMCGGLQLASYSDELAGYFEDGKEIVLYRSDDEFISKSQFYLDPKNDLLVRKMKENARRRAENDHTWMNRFDRLFQTIR